MKVLEVQPINEYSCMFCQKIFESEAVLFLFWFCSKSCQYKFAYTIVKQNFPNATKEKQFALTKKLCEVTIK